MTNTQASSAGRLAQIRRDVMERHGSFIQDINPFQADVATWRALQPGRSVVQVRAAYLRELTDIATVAIYPTWTIAGEHMVPGHGISYGLLDAKNESRLDRLVELGTGRDKADEIRQAVEKWVHRQESFPMYAVGETDPQLALGKGPWEAPLVLMAGGWIENHSVRDFAKVLRIGFDGIGREILSCMEAADLAAPQYVQQENFWKAAMEVCQGGVRLGHRYAELAAAMAGQTSDPADAARLRAMADACGRVPASGARTLREAVQSLWLAHILSCGEDGINANSIGRLDQILQPYYQADLQAGRISREQAVELMEELACKLYLDYEVQAITLAGAHPDGADATNEMTYIILEATGNVEFSRDVSVRLHRNSSEKLIRTAAELVARGGGIPFFFNDDCFIQAMADHGITLADARNYAPIGCIELTVPGKANPHAVSGWINAAKCLELALFDGLDPRTGRQIGPRTGSLADHKTYDDLWSAYERQLEHFTRAMVYLADESVEYWVFQRMAERYPSRTEVLLRAALKDDTFLLGDLDVLLRRFKGEAMRYPVRPMVTMVNLTDEMDGTPGQTAFP